MNAELEKKFEEVGLKIPEIVLPNKNINLQKFSCIAADQFSANKNYWEEVEKFVGKEKSTYNLIFPECFMPLTDEKLQSINSTMDDYIKEKVVEEQFEGLVYVERNTSSGIRRGLIVCIDLEKYDFEKNSKSLIRATEGTVKDRLPIRVKIRENASLDIPHIMVLIDDKEYGLNNICKSFINNDKKLYAFDLMYDGGNIKGYKIDKEDELNDIANYFLKLKSNMRDNLLFAVGDGNHSLAAAKIVYENEKKKYGFELKKVRKRYALVEIVNIYDSGLQFFPIHRLLINVDRDDFVKNVDINLPLQDLQIEIDKYLENHKETKLEYIHGKEECEELGKNPNNFAITFSEFPKDDFFEVLIFHGSLCRKSFSMGEAKDKRYYLEMRLLK